MKVESKLLFIEFCIVPTSRRKTGILIIAEKKKEDSMKPGVERMNSTTGLLAQVRQTQAYRELTLILIVNWIFLPTPAWGKS